MISAVQRQVARDAWTALRIAKGLGIQLPARERFILERQACLIPLARIGADPTGISDPYVARYWPYTRERIRQLGNQGKRAVAEASRDTPVAFYHHERFGR